MVLIKLFWFSNEELVVEVLFVELLSKVILVEVLFWDTVLLIAVLTDSYVLLFFLLEELKK